ncbi:hypothetical protein QW180_08610 [Vibrio sinaloensis]|nr:hypothetical protein [Vibrio sinaloensis]
MKAAKFALLLSIPTLVVGCGGGSGGGSGGGGSSTAPAKYTISFVALKKTPML